MFIARAPLILASASPRRKAYFDRLGLAHRVVPATIDETPESGEPPELFARRMAAAKARQIAALYPDAIVIGADTVVTLGGRIFGKPNDRADALTMLTLLQGQTHAVITGLAIITHTRHVNMVDATVTQVSFGRFSEAILKAYVATGEPMDKAGAYGIQGVGSFLVHTINGSYSNVVGLPVQALVQALLAHGLIEPVT